MLFPWLSVVSILIYILIGDATAQYFTTYRDGERAGHGGGGWQHSDGGKVKRYTHCTNIRNNSAIIILP